MGPFPPSGRRAQFDFRGSVPHRRRKNRRVVGDLGQHDDTQGTRPPSEWLRRGTSSRLILLCSRGGLVWDIEAEYEAGTPENAVAKCGVSRDQSVGAVMSINF